MSKPEYSNNYSREVDPKLLVNLPCPNPDCDGRLQIYENKGVVKISCYRCGTKIKLDSVKIAYEVLREKEN